jgi:glycosyltransferase involved in cell wall biosynthesis
MEGFGLPALEAMANKCLVLASDIPSLKEVCGDAAIFFDPHSINDIAKKMNEVYYNDAYHYSDKKEKGLGRSKFFSWRRMAKETLKVYNSFNS